MNDETRNPPPPQFKSNRRSTKRRLVLKGGAVAGISLPFIPKQWARPVVESVSLPVHATTSVRCESGTYVASIGGTTLDCFIPVSCVTLILDCTNSTVDITVVAPDTDPFVGTFPVNDGSFSGLLQGTGADTGNTTNVTGTLNGAGEIVGEISEGNFCVGVVDPYTAQLNGTCVVSPPP